MAETPIDPAVIHAQVILDRAGFSPGVIDGRRGSQLALALRGFQAAHGLKPTGTFDDQTNATLAADKTPALVRLAIDKDDAAGPFIPIPSDPIAQAKLPALGYSSLLEELAEKYHTTPATILALNPKAKALGEGVVLMFPNVVTDDHAYAAQLPAHWRATLAQLNIPAQEPQAAKIVVTKSEDALRAYDADGKLIAQFPATLGSAHDPLPIGEWKILGASYNPKFHYNTSLFWDANDKSAKAVLPPGPNGPVGVIWLDLSKPHYGIHGTPEPSRVGRGESHGCIRLTNWDAARLSLMVKPGTPAVFEN